MKMISFALFTAVMSISQMAFASDTVQFNQQFIWISSDYGAANSLVNELFRATGTVTDGKNIEISTASNKVELKVLNGNGAYGRPYFEQLWGRTFALHDKVAQVLYLALQRAGHQAVSVRIPARTYTETGWHKMIRGKYFECGVTERGYPIYHCIIAANTINN